jgi:acyl dehydratase
MAGIYFDDYEIGKIYITPTRTITETDVVYFAAMSGDMNEIHTSEQFAKGTPFGRRIVHGLLGLSICHGLMFRLSLFDGTGIAFLNVENWKFTSPILFGDTVYAKVDVKEKIPSRSKPDRGVIKFFVQLINQDGIVTQEGVQVLMIKRKGGADE